MSVNNLFKITIVYNNNKDKELLDLIDTTIPFFINYINMNTVKGRSEGFKLMNYWSAKKLPLVIIENEDSNILPIIKYSDIGESAINQLIKYLNEYNKSNTQK